MSVLAELKILELLEHSLHVQRDILETERESLHVQHESLHVQRESLHVLCHILRELTAENPNRTTQLKVVFGDDQMAAALPGSELVGQSVIATAVAYEIDGITPTPGAVVSGQVWSISDPTIATLTSNTDGTATFLALANGTATVTVTGNVLDTDGTTNAFTGTNTLTVGAGGTGRSAGLQISFGTPA